jgi:isoquinoline 1-oxidoreductase beta subunit
METMIDRMAHAAGQDGVAYRRALLKDAPRNLAVLNLAADKAEWGKPLPSGHYHGIAVHASFRSYVAQIVEISLDQNANLVVHKVTCAIDCGLTINPENVKAQMEGGILFGLTMAKYGELSISNGKVDQNNFYDYRIARMNETPEIEVHLIPHTGQAMGGVGETGVPPLAPALANALFAATGKRIQSLPLMNQSFKRV